MPYVASLINKNNIKNCRNYQRMCSFTQGPFIKDILNINVPLLTKNIDRELLNPCVGY